MPPDDQARIEHMLEAARRVRSATDPLTRSQLEADDLRTLGIIKCIEIIGEAAAHVDAETQKRFPHIPWPQVVGMRNRLVHGYFSIDMDQVWKTITEDSPQLIEWLEHPEDA